MSRKFTILFDLDGTLVDTAPDLLLAHNYVMKKYGYREKKLPDIKKLAGGGSRAMLNRSMYKIAELSGKMKEATKGFAQPNAAKIIAQEVLDMALSHEG